jgi:hypothetical protein
MQRQWRWLSIMLKIRNNLCLAHFPMMVVAKYAEIGEMVVKLKLQTKPCKS